MTLVRKNKVQVGNQQLHVYHRLLLISNMVEALNVRFCCTCTNSATLVFVVFKLVQRHGSRHCLNIISNDLPKQYTTLSFL